MKARFPAILFVCGTLLTSTAAHAEGFIGVGLSNNSYAYSDLDNSNGHKIFGGYYMQDGVFLEVAHIDLGDTESDIAPIGLEISGFAAYVGYSERSRSGIPLFWQTRTLFG